MPKKVWIKGFEGLYKISEDGKVFTYKTGKGTIKEGSELKQSKNAKGYSQLRLLVSGVVLSNSIFKHYIR